MEFDKIKLLYEENAKVTHVFWEWRHKIMNRFFIAIASIFTLCGWMVVHNKLLEFIFIPLLIGAAYSFVSKKMDNVNTWILRDSYRIGGELEHDIAKKDMIYGSINKGHYKKGSYASILSILYITFAVFYSVLSIISLIVFTICHGSI